MCQPSETSFCSCSQGTTCALPEKGQTVRVTLLKDVDGWQGKGRVLTPAGTMYTGVVADIDSEGFFDIATESGETRGFYAKDKTLKIEVFMPEPVA